MLRDARRDDRPVLNLNSRGTIGSCPKGSVERGAEPGDRYFVKTDLIALP